MKAYLNFLLFSCSIFLFSQKKIERNYFYKLKDSTHYNFAHKKALDTLQYNQNQFNQNIQFDALRFLIDYYIYRNDPVKFKKYFGLLNPKSIPQQYLYNVTEGFINMHNNHHIKAIQKLLKAKKIIRNKYYDPRFMADYYLSIIYLKYKNYNKIDLISHEYFDFLHKKNIKYHPLKNRFFNTLVESYTFQKKYTKALQYADSAIYYTSYYKDTLGDFYSKRLKSYTLIDKKEYAKAKKIALEIDKPFYLNASNLNTLSFYKTLNYYNLGRIYYETHQLDSAEYYLEKDYKKILNYQYHQFYHSTIQMYSNILAKKKEYKKAYELLDKMIQKKDSIYNISTLNKILESELNYIEEIQKINYKKKQERWYWILTFVLILIILIITLYFFKLYTVTILKRKNNLIKKKNNKLEKLNNSLEKFTQIVSHDLKAPIRTIEHLTTFIKEDEKTTITNGSKEKLEYINLAVRRSNDLIINLLALAKSNDNSIVMKKVEFSVILDAVKSNLFQLISGSNALIKLKDNNSTIEGNESLLIQFFQNIIENSIKYARENHNPIIEIFTSEDEKNTAFYIKDNGIGIKDEKKIILFNSLSQEKFESLDKGVGLGLYITKKIADIHQAKITIESNKNDFGTLVTIIFPKNVK